MHKIFYDKLICVGGEVERYKWPILPLKVMSEVPMMSNRIRQKIDENWAEMQT